MPNRVTEQLKDVWLITRKELLYLSRDPDVLMYTVLCPLVLYPVIFVGFNDMAMWLVGQYERQKSTIAIQRTPDRARHQLVVDAIKTIQNAKAVESPDAMADLHAGKLDAYVTFEPPNSVFVNVAQSSLVDRTAGRITGAIAIERFEREEKAIKTVGLTRRDLRVFDLERIDVAPSASKGEVIPVQELGGIPLAALAIFAFIWVHIAIGMGPPAAVMFAEQREKRTFDTALVEPVSRGSLVGGKLLTTWIVGLISGITYSIGLLITFGTIFMVILMHVAEKSGLGERTAGIAKLVSLANLRGGTLESWLLLVLTAVLNSGLCAMFYIVLTARAPSFKQAQALITIPMLVSIMVACASFVPGLELNMVTAFLPFLNLFLALKRGEPDVMLTLIAIGFNLVVFAVAFGATRYMVSSNKSTA